MTLPPSVRHLVLLSVACGLAGAAVDERQLQAAFLYNFAQFVSWPEPGRAVVIAVYGADAVAAALEDAVRGKPAAGRTIVVRRVRTAREIMPCAMLFVAGADYRKVREALLQAGSAPVLTVGEGEEFLSRGGMIALLMRERRIRFLVDAAAARRAGLHISSRLLSLAEQVME